MWLGYYSIAGIPGPLVCGHNGDGSWYPAGPYAAGQVVATSGDGGAVAWLLQHYATTTDPTQAAAIDAINSKYGSNDGGLDDYNIAEANGLGSEIDSMLAAGRQNAGPYKITIAGLVTSATGHFDVTYSATVKVHSAAGFAVPNLTVKLTSNNAKLSTASVRTNNNGQATFKYSVPLGPSGNFTITAASSAPVLIRYNYLGGSGAGKPQDVVGFGTRPVSMTAAGSVDPYVGNLTFIKYTAGDASKTPVAGAVYSVTDLTDGRQLGSITSQAVPISLGGANIQSCDVLQFTETKAPPGHYLAGPVTVTIPCTATSDYQIAVADPVTPTPGITTAANAVLARPDTVLSDSVTITGDDGEDGTDTASIVLVTPAPAGSSCASITAAQWGAGTTLATYTHQIDGSVNNGNGTFTITGSSAITYGMSITGCYGWKHHLILSPSGATADSAPTDSGENSLVMIPRLSTRASSTGLIQAGDYLTDTVTLADTHGQPATLVGEFDRTGPRASGRQTVCSNGPPDQWPNSVKVASIAAFTITGDGDHPVPGKYRSTTPACYSFGYTATVGMPAGQPPLTINLAPGDPSETAWAVMPTPTLATTANAGLTGTATVLSDRVTVSSNNAEDGTDTAALVGPVKADPAAQDCWGVTAAQWAAAGTIATYTHARSTGRSTTATARSPSPARRSAPPGQAATGGATTWCSPRPERSRTARQATRGRTPSSSHRRWPPRPAAPAPSRPRTTSPTPSR